MNVDGGFQLSDVGGIVRRRGKVTALVALAFALVAYWVAMALPNEYRSYATVLVEPQAVDEELVRAGVQSSDLNERLHLMTAQILSRARLSRIIDEFNLYQEESEYLLRENIIGLMRERIKVAPVVSDLEQGQGRTRQRDLEINEFKIFFTDYDAGVAAQVAQRLANDFIENHINARVQVSQKSLEFIQSELERLAERIRAVEAQVAKVKNEHPGQLPEDMLANQRRLERVLSDSAVAQRALAEATSDESFYRSQVAQAAAFSAPNDAASPVRRLELLRLSLAELKSRGFTDKHPDVIASTAEIASLEKAVDELDADGAPMNLVAQQTEAQARRAGLRRQAAEQEIFRLQGLADEIQDLLGKTPAVAELLDGLNREYEHLFSSFQDFSNRHLEATVQAQLERRQLGEQFRVLEAAFAASRPSAPNRPVIILLGIIFGLALGAGMALVLETADTSPHSARKLQTQIQLPVLASIPQIWLEADRIALRRRRLRSVAATAAVVVFGLAGGAMNYMWVNGAPGFLQSGDEEAPLDAGGTSLETAETGS
jgi:polysaccharide chain length determinant protein (PEP-CTERM system associated)